MPKFIVEREIPGASKMTRGRTPGSGIEITRSSEAAWSGDSVDPQLRHGR